MFLSNLNLNGGYCIEQCSPTGLPEVWGGGREAGFEVLSPSAECPPPRLGLVAFPLPFRKEGRLVLSRNFSTSPALESQCPRDNRSLAMCHHNWGSASLPSMTSARLGNSTGAHTPSGSGWLCTWGRRGGDQVGKAEAFFSSLLLQRVPETGPEVNIQIFKLWLCSHPHPQLGKPESVWRGLSEL